MKCVHFMVFVSEFSPHSPPITSSELRKVFVDDEREVGTQDSSERHLRLCAIHVSFLCLCI